MFRTWQCPSSGSHELRLTEVTSFVSVLAFSVCAVSVWRHILTLGGCVCVCVPVAPVKADEEFLNF
jgi:hypothetical protein